VVEINIDLVNQWQNVENAEGRRPRLKMQDHYSDIKMLVLMANV